MKDTILTYIIFAPIIAALMVLFIPRNYRFVIRNAALLVLTIILISAITIRSACAPVR